MEPLGWQAMPCLFDWSSRKAQALNKSPDVNREHQQVTGAKGLAGCFVSYLFILWC